MRPLPRSPLFIFGGYVLTVVLVALTTGAAHILRDKLDVQIETVVYLLPVVISTLLWGLGPGIFAAILGFLAFNYFFIQPLYTLLVGSPQNLLVLLAFLALAVVLNQLLGRTRAALAEAQAREHEAIHLYELSTALAGQHDGQAIARSIAQYALDTLQADRVEVLVEDSADHTSSSVQLPPDRVITPDRLPTTLMPLSTVRGRQGEMSDRHRRADAQNLCQSGGTGAGTRAAGALGNAGQSRRRKRSLEERTALVGVA